jgi:spoIIIJ-associated protein
MGADAETTSRGGASELGPALQELLEKVAAGMGVDAQVQVTEDGEDLHAQYTGEDVGPLIGHHGHTIDAIQHLAYRMLFRVAQRPVRVVVDAEGYRERRAMALKATADQAAEAAIHDQRPVALEAMNALERKVVHEHLKDRHDVETYSEGEEPDRRLVVAPVVH